LSAGFNGLQFLASRNLKSWGKFTNWKNTAWNQ